MPTLRDLRISRKLGYAFGIVCLFTAILGTASLFGFLSIKTVVDDIVGNSIPSMKAVFTIRTALSDLRRAEGYILFCKTSECSQYYSQKRTSALDSYNKTIDAYASMVSYPGERELYETLRQNVTAYIALDSRVQELVAAGKKDEAEQVLVGPEMFKAYVTTMSAAQADLDLNSRASTEEGDHAVRLIHSLVVSATVLVLGPVNTI